MSAERRRIPEPSVAQVRAMAIEQDRRRRAQIDAQKEAIVRLVGDPAWTWGMEEDKLMAEVAETRARLEAVVDFVAEKQYSSIARKVLALCGEDV